MMPSIPQLLVVAVLFLILFQSKNIPQLLSDIGSGIRAFRTNLKEDTDTLDTHKP
ncbi:MAG: twin-arginine translocase TatA/TatE family subunit [Pseudomonadota bacterium]